MGKRWRSSKSRGRGTTATSREDATNERECGRGRDAVGKRRLLQHSLSNGFLDFYDKTKTFQQSEAEFFAKLEADLVLAQTYEDKSNQEAALKCIPRAELEKLSEEKFESLKTKDPKTKPSLKRDILLLELLRWFKEEFFSWVDSPASCCEKEGGTTRSKGMLFPTPQEQSDGAGRVEG